MKVLYMLANYPQASESYIEAEMSYVRSRGVEVEVWAIPRGHSTIEQVPVHRGSIQRAVAEFKPDLIHVHYLMMAAQHLPIFRDIPATVRAHSFDWNPVFLNAVTSIESVRAVYAFPHFASESTNKKVIAMPVAYDASLYDPPLKKPSVRNAVIRLAAGRRVKGLEDFIEVSRAVYPRATFDLAVSQVNGDEKYVVDLLERASKNGVHGRMNIERAEAVEMIRTAGIYLDTSDPMGHPFGMPISVAEAMAAGLVVLIRDSKAAREFVGDAGAMYGSVAEAIELVKIGLGLSEAAIQEVRQLSIERAKLYRNDVVLPRLIEDWKKFIS